MARLFFAVFSLVISGKLAKGEPVCSPVTLNISDNVRERHNVTTKVDDGHVVYTTAEGYAFKKVMDHFTEVATFDLKEVSPKTVTKYNIDENVYVTIALEPSHHLVFKKKGDEYAELKLPDFYQNVLFKDFEKVTVDADKFEVASYFESSLFGSGKMYEFPSANKRPFKIVSGGEKLIGENDEILIDVVIYAKGDEKILRVGYVSRADSRIKEVFFQKFRSTWSRIKVSDAAKVLNEINSSFPLDYESLYDGCSVLTVLLSVTMITFFVVFQ